MKRFLCLLLLLGMSSRPIWAQNNESCGPKSGLCWPKVKRGSSGARVVALQYLLRAKGYRVTPDGTFGYVTESAIRKFQAKNRLQVDGRVGWQTWESLTPNLKRGARGDAVRALQTLLSYQDYKVARDGIFGAATRNAILKFQHTFEFQDIELDRADGKVDDGEWCLLINGSINGE